MSGQAASYVDHAEVRAASGSNDGSQRHARPEQPGAERPANAVRPPPPPKELRPTQSRPADAGRPQPAAHGRGANFGPPGKRPIHALKAHKEISTEQRGPPTHAPPAEGYRPAADWARDMSSALGDIGDSAAQVDQARKLQAHAEAKTPYIGSSEHHESGLVTENAHGLIREGVPAPPARPPRLYRPVL